MPHVIHSPRRCSHWHWISHGNQSMRGRLCSCVSSAAISSSESTNRAKHFGIEGSATVERLQKRQACNAWRTPASFPLTPCVLQASHIAFLQVSNMMVMFIRFLISCEIQRRQDFFCPFIMVSDRFRTRKADVFQCQDNRLLLCDEHPQ